MKVVAYYRYSSNKQTEQSIEGQQRICRAFCERNGYNIVREYIDRATSASKDVDKRTSFLQMIKDASSHQWDAVIVYKLDRFARSRYDSAVYKSKLYKHGVKVISATENISNDPEGIILESVLEGMAEFYSKELSQKVTRGLRESAFKAQSTGGTIPLGYKVDKEQKKLVIDETEAETVREIYRLYASGMGATEICRTLNAHGYRNRGGKPFGKNSFHRLLTNEKYIGTYKYNDIIIEDAMPPIVDRELFDAVQERIAHAPKYKKHSTEGVNYLLSGKAFCCHCGARLVGENGKSHTGAIHYYYSCATHKRGKGCKKKSIRKDTLERLVCEDIKSILDEAMIERLADMAVKQNRIDIANNTQIPTLEAEAARLEKGIDNLLTLAESAGGSASIAKRITALEEQLADTQTRLDEAKASLIILDKVQIVWFLSTFLDGDIEDEEFRDRLIRVLLNSVTVTDEDDGTKLTLVYNLTENNTRIIRGSDLDSIVSPTITYTNPCFFEHWCVKVIKTR